MARFDLPLDGTQYLLAQVGDDVAMLPYSTYYSANENGWQPRSVSDKMRWFVYDDRAMYRPGEEVHLKGWIRKIGGGQIGRYRPRRRRVDRCELFADRRVGK